MKLPKSNQSQIIGYTETKTPIRLFCFGRGAFKILMLGGVHGDEKEGFLFAKEFCEELQARHIVLPKNIQLYLCEQINPDGCLALRRTNHRNVDLNRNLGTKDWTSEFKNTRYYPGSKANSEIESKLSIQMIKKIQPAFILSLHSYEHPMINYNGPCEELAKVMSKKNNLEPKADIGYPTPGSLGTYAGWERNIPTITLEILRGQDPKEVWKIHKEAVFDTFAVVPKLCTA